MLKLQERHNLEMYDRLFVVLQGKYLGDEDNKWEQFSDAS